jgi:hypothetical protein
MRLSNRWLLASFLLVITVPAAMAHGGEMVGTWSETLTVQGPLAPIVSKTITEYKADGTFTSATRSSDGLNQNSSSASGSYVYENGILRSTARVTMTSGRRVGEVVYISSKVSIRWISDNTFEATVLESTLPPTIGWRAISTRVR